MRSITLPIAGMTCDGCAAAVRKALSAVPGVRSVQVSLPAARAEIDADAHASEAALAAAVELAGFSIAPRTQP